MVGNHWVAFCVVGLALQACCCKDEPETEPDLGLPVRADADVGPAQDGGAGDADVGPAADADVGPADDAGAGDCGADGAPCVVWEDQPGEDESCTASRRVGRLAGGDRCPEADPNPDGAGRWTAALLFDRRMVGDTRLPVPDPDAAFCVYTWEGAEDRKDELLPADRQRGPDEWLERDCAVTGAQQEAGDAPGAVREEIWAPLHADFLDTAQAPGNLPELTPEAPEAPYPRGVRVAIVDTAADLDPEAFVPGTHDNAQHGRAMGLFVRELACPDCPALPDSPLPGQVEITNHAALDIVEPGRRDPVRGGRYGYQGHLAWGIYDAVAKWMADHGPNTPGPDIRPRLIINLSVGWDPLWRHPRGDNNHDRQAVQAVRIAIEHAVCSGALVIAAAGNDSGGAHAPSGPMFPGAWEQAPLPDRCARAFAGDYPPLVHAVGGVDARDEPLGNTRLDGRPRLAAPGFYAITELEPGRPTGFFTGTSVSTAVVSATAAIVWRYLPDLTGAEVMDRVYAAATLLPGDPAPNQPADFCLYSPSCENLPIRRVTACSGLRAALHDRCADAVPPAGCAGLDLDAQCPEHPPFSRHNPEFATNAVSPDAETNGEDLTQPVTTPGCSYATQVASPSDLPDAPCPDDQFYGGGMAPWAVLPQPEDPGCDVCALMLDGPAGTLVLGINKSFDAPLKSPKLVLSNGLAYDLGAKFGLTGLEPGRIYKITGLPLSASPFKTAKLTFYFLRNGKSYSGASEIPWWAI